MAKIGLLGAGTMGLATARLLCLNGHEVTVWSALAQEIDELSATRVHPKLPYMKIPDELCFTKDIAEACRDTDLCVFAVPSVFVRKTAALAAPHLAADQLIADVAKGIEPSTLMTMTDVITDQLRKHAPFEGLRIVALSGPTHSEEIAVDLPTTIVAASRDHQAAAQVQDLFMNRTFRVYTNTDILGVELCGALKNVIALSVGISTGLGYGDNTKAATITRGLAEITRLGLAMGCRPETFSGLAGVGDLIVTCTSVHSRNYNAGLLIGQGLSKDEALQKVGMVVEGIYAIEAGMELSEKYQVEMPIVFAVNEIINQGKNPEEAVFELMQRDRRME